MKTYTARCEREGDWWIVTVPELDGVFTHAKRLDRVEELAADAIALWLDVPASTFKVRREIVGVDAAQALWKEAADVRNHAKQLQRDAVRQLTDELGVSVRDAAVVLDVSFQRVAQLAGSSTKQTAAAKRAPTKAAAKQHSSRKAATKVTGKAKAKATSR